MSPADEGTPLTVADCARRLGVSTQKIRDELRAGEIPHRKSERRSGRTMYRIERADFEAYLARVWPKHSRPKEHKETA